MPHCSHAARACTRATGHFSSYALLMNCRTCKSCVHSVDQKLNQNYVNRCWISIKKTHHKSTQHLLRSIPKTIEAKVWLHDLNKSQKVSAPDVLFERFGDTWAILGAVRAQFGGQLGAKGRFWDLFLSTDLPKSISGRTCKKT